MLVRVGVRGRGRAVLILARREVKFSVLRVGRGR